MVEHEPDGSPATSILLIASDASQHELAAPLAQIGHLQRTSDPTAAMELIGETSPDVVLIDAQAFPEAASGLVSAAAERGRVLVWDAMAHPSGFAGDGVVRVTTPVEARLLLQMARLLVEVCRTRQHGAGNDPSSRLDRVIAQVRDVRHEIGTPLSAIMAEAELQILEAETLTPELKRGLETIARMARNIRDQLHRLRELGN